MVPTACLTCQVTPVIHPADCGHLSHQLANMGYLSHQPDDLTTFFSCLPTSWRFSTIFWDLLLLWVHLVYWLATQIKWDLLVLQIPSFFKFLLQAELDVFCPFHFVVESPSADSPSREVSTGSHGSSRASLRPSSTSQVVGDKYFDREHSPSPSVPEEQESQKVVVLQRISRSRKSSRQRDLCKVMG